MSTFDNSLRGVERGNALRPLYKVGDIVQFTEEGREAYTEAGYLAPDEQVMVQGIVDRYEYVLTTRFPNSRYSSSNLLEISARYLMPPAAPAMIEVARIVEVAKKHAESSGLGAQINQTLIDMGIAGGLDWTDAATEPAAPKRVRMTVVAETTLEFDLPASLAGKTVEELTQLANEKLRDSREAAGEDIESRVTDALYEAGAGVEVESIADSHLRVSNRKPIELFDKEPAPAEAADSSW